jgi:endonuclease YncB( thermonuclease family)
VKPFLALAAGLAGRLRSRQLAAAIDRHSVCRTCLLPGRRFGLPQKKRIFGTGLVLSWVAVLPPASAATPIVSAGRSFTCTPTAVWDGDGPIWCAEGPKIRIAGVAARETDGTCRSNQPCPAVGARDARDRLVRLLGGPRGSLPTGHVKVRSPSMQCTSDGSAGGARTAAWCTSPAFGDLSCAVVEAGGAVTWPRYWKNHHC